VPDRIRLARAAAPQAPVSARSSSGIMRARVRRTARRWRRGRRPGSVLFLRRAVLNRRR
jgi:hypothetical protein